jgi:hypothetical protein
VRGAVETEEAWLGLDDDEGFLAMGQLSDNLRSVGFYNSYESAEELFQEVVLSCP